MEFQLRRSCILKPQHEPKIDQEIDMKPPSTSDFRLNVTCVPPLSLSSSPSFVPRSFPGASFVQRWTSLAWHGKKRSVNRVDSLSPKEGTFSVCTSFCAPRLIPAINPWRVIRIA